MNKTNKFSPEVRERAVRLVQEHRGEYPAMYPGATKVERVEGHAMRVRRPGVVRRVIPWIGKNIGDGLAAKLSWRVVPFQLRYFLAYFAIFLVSFATPTLTP